MLFRLLVIMKIGNELSCFDINKIIGAFNPDSKDLDIEEIKWAYLKKKHGL